MDKINPALTPLIRPISTLNKDPKNARRHSERNLKAIMTSLKENGQQKPIAVLDGVVVAGNGTLEAAIRLGWTSIAVVEFDGTEKQARKYAIQDNRTAELAEWDPVGLHKSLADLGDTEWEATGFTNDEARAFTSVYNMPSSQAPSADAPPADSEELTHDGAETGRTPEDKLDTFLNNTLRQIVLIYKAEDHTRIVAAMETLCARDGHESNAALVDALVKEALGE